MWTTFDLGKRYRVAVGVSAGKIEGANVFAVQVHRNVVIEGE